MRRWLVCLGVAVSLAVAAPGARGAADGTRGKVAGVMMVTPQSGANLDPAEAQRVRAAGANAAGITVYWETTDDQNAVRREAVSISDEPLRASIRTARQAGLEVILHLMLHCRTCPNKWRGDIDPSDPEAFFESYRTMVAHYADIAEAEGVSSLFIGSEMNSVQHYADEWRAVAAEARERFDGTLVYEVNWDATAGFEFADALDEVGVSAYFPLTDKPRPTVAEIKAAWQLDRSGGASWFDRVKALSASTGKRVVFGEVGYRSTEYGGRRPWEAYGDERFHAQTQANLYQALLETFEDQSWWSGTTWWEWTRTSGSEGRGFTPRDKPAEALLRSWWAEGKRPGRGTVHPDGSLITDASPVAAPSGDRAAATPSRRGAPTTASVTTGAPTSVGQAAASEVTVAGAAAPVARGALGETPQSDGPGGAGVVAGAVLVLVPLSIASALLLRRARTRAREVLLPSEFS